jgi:hypothetical protein
MSTRTPLTGRQKIINDVRLLLGYGMVDVELDPGHYELAFELALDRYRQGSSNAMEESFVFIDVQPEVQVYSLPEEVQEVRDVYRHSMGATNSGGATVDPFSLAFTNNLYLLSSPTGLAGGSNTGTGMLATYELATQYQNLVGRMFGRDLLYTWNAASKKIRFERRFTGTEQVCLHVWNTKPEDMLVADTYARPWIRDYTLARCKMMLGEAYSKFTNGLAGPQGGISLKGDALKQEGKEEMERLEQEIQNFKDAHMGMPFIIG